MSDAVVVNIISGKASNSRVNFLRRLFSNPYFIVRVHDVDTDIRSGVGDTTATPTFKNVSCLDDPDAMFEISQVYSSLMWSRENYPDKPAIVIKDTSTSNIGSSTMQQIIQEAVTSISLSSYELFYMSKWLDRCHLYKRVTPNTESENRFVWIYSPFGVQSILLTPTGRDIILGIEKMKNGKNFKIMKLPLGQQLNKEISDGNMRAIANPSNIINFDVVGNATDNSDYLKLNECVPFLFDQVEETTSNAGSYLVLALIIIAIILIGWALLRVGPKK